MATCVSMLPLSTLFVAGLVGSSHRARPPFTHKMVAPLPATSPPLQVLPRGLLLAAAIGYGSNFPVGRLMNEVVPACATTSGRFALAALLLSPFLPKLDKRLIMPAILSGLADGIGYVSQSIALVDTPAAKVAFLGALTVVWVPALDAIFSGRDLRLRAAPQVWIAASLTLLGLAFLELGADTTEVLAGGLQTGDLWAAGQAVGFGSSFWIIERMMGDGEGEDAVDALAAAQSKVSDISGASADGPLDSQALPITAVNVGVVAILSAAWAMCDGFGLGPLAGSASAGWLADESLRSQYALPGLLLGPVGLAALWTGIATTAMTRVGETVALGSVSAADAAVVVATEPLWAALFGVVLCDEVLQGSDILGGALLVSACLASSMPSDEVVRWLPWLYSQSTSSPEVPPRQ